MGHSVDSSLKSNNNDNNTSIDKLSLASSLACVVDESSQSDERKPMNRLELKRFLELRIKKRVKDQFKDGKFHDLVEKVIANPYTLQDAYDSIRVNSKVDLASECDNIDFTSLAEELASGNFDISSNIYSFSTRGENKEKLILPNLKTNVIQEAIRIALEVVYRPHFSKISHGCRNGRGQSSALKYICKEIVNPDWWFPVILNKKIDMRILSKLISTIETKIEDPKLYSIIHSMFNVGVLNMEFGGFAKGHGLPQEGVLSPVLMNIYLDLFDREILNLSMKYEVLDTHDDSQCDESKSESKLRSWFRRQMGPYQKNEGNMSGVRVHCCRLMDEILIVIKGSKEVSQALKSEIETYLQSSLYLDFDSKTSVLQCNDRRGVKFTGNVIKRSARESPAVRAVHKLKEKVELFALQKEEAWNEGMVRIGKKVLGHGFKKVKESEIKHLADCTSVLSHVSRFRKLGMKTDHWYKVLLKVWMQGQNFRSHDTEEYIISKLITEKALPEDLKDSFYTFQNEVKRYVTSETKSTVNLLPESSTSSESVYVTEVSAPLKAIRMCLHRYGIMNREGYPRACHTLVLLDHDNIIDWYNGIVMRWVKWYHLCDNFGEIKNINEKVRKSCTRTLATKYRLHETEIERKFESDLSKISLTEDSVSEILESRDLFYDEGLLYGVNYSGLCLLSLARVVSESRPCTCFVIGCREAAPCVYTIHIMQRQKFPVWKTGFSSCVHPSLNRRRVGLCKQHLKDLFIGHISHQSICFDDWK